MAPNDVETEEGRAFLRWVAGAGEVDDCTGEMDGRAGDGSSGDDGPRTWGQLRIERLPGDGGTEPRYDLRHVDDAAVDVDDLDAYDDPLDARGIATFDDRGRYRPLKSAPSLATGWVFPELSPGELIDAVGFFYPATIANWHLERAGDLDVTHWRETADRQTGIYDVVDELPADAVGWAAEACCVDSQCLKRRRWEYDDDHELDVPGGNGEFPCREPCSLLIAAAREWALVEREEAETYEMELAPTEYEQLQAILDAVADGRAGDVREADFDDPANRYRARYLRAKRFSAADPDDSPPQE